MSDKSFISYGNMESIMTKVHDAIESSTGNSIFLSESSVSITVGESAIVYAFTNSHETLTAASSNTSVATVSVLDADEKGTGIQINAVAIGDITVTVSAGGASTILNVESDVVHIFGAEWDGSSSPAWTRTDGAVGFSDPNPYYSGMSGTPSSPFDTIMPWSGMRRVSYSAAGELVEIPKFWYKWTRTGTAMKLQISSKAEPGFFVSPAHADRGDGVGERDYVYISRYNCASTFKSTTGVSSIGNYTRAEFRTYIHNLGTDVWQNDFAMFWTVRMLYLVEFANWNAQAKIGFGLGSSTTNGLTDSMSYHTGTTASSRSSTSITQYRYIENLWGGKYCWIDGVYKTNTTVYCIKKPSDFAITGGVSVGTTTSATGYPVTWNEPSAEGFEYALFPATTNDNLDGTTYACDRYYAPYSSSCAPFTGGASGDSIGNKGGPFMFTIDRTEGESQKHNVIGSRLMVLPSQRITS